ncbi:hypothetical protein SVAN01_08609 [Stagonosporopsis vannaccii]|nr:hypothetical protein SVAN01_08609 [Stagonosporopsis vannaccii]
MSDAAVDWRPAAGGGEGEKARVSGCGGRSREGQRAQAHSRLNERAPTNSYRAETVLGPQTVVWTRCASGEARVEVRRLVGRGLRGPPRAARRESTSRPSRRRGRVCDNGAWVSLESVERQNESSEENGCERRNESIELSGRRLGPEPALGTLVTFRRRYLRLAEGQSAQRLRGGALGTRAGPGLATKAASVALARCNAASKWERRLRTGHADCCRGYGASGMAWLVSGLRVRTWQISAVGAVPAFHNTAPERDGARGQRRRQAGRQQRRRACTIRAARALEAAPQSRYPETSSFSNDVLATASQTLQQGPHYSRKAVCCSVQPAFTQQQLRRASPATSAVFASSRSTTTAQGPPARRCVAPRQPSLESAATAPRPEQRSQRSHPRRLVQTHSTSTPCAASAPPAASSTVRTPSPQSRHRASLCPIQPKIEG